MVRRQLESTPTEVRYVCSSCGRLNPLPRLTLRPGQLQPFLRRVRCISARCRGTKRPHYPARYPLSGAYDR